MNKYTKINFDMSDEAYRATAGISQSMLKPLFKSPAHYKQQFEEEKKTTDAMVLGTITHLATFQPKLFGEQVIIAPKFDRRKPADKEAEQRFLEENVGKYCVDQKDYDLALAISDSVKNTERHAELTSSGHAEVCVFSHELPYEDIYLKGKIDWINFDKKIILDLKTTSQSLDNEYVVKNIIKDLLYDVQQAMYEMLLDHNGLANFEFIFEFVESKAPHGVRFIKISPTGIKKAKDKLDVAIALLQHCTTHNMWTAYPEEIKVIDV
jgi:hypothetical protein